MVVSQPEDLQAKYLVLTEETRTLEREKEEYYGRRGN